MALRKGAAAGHVHFVFPNHRGHSSLPAEASEEQPNPSTDTTPIRLRRSSVPAPSKRTVHPQKHISQRRVCHCVRRNAASLLSGPRQGSGRRWRRHQGGGWLSPAPGGHVANQIFLGFAWVSCGTEQRWRLQEHVFLFFNRLGTALVEMRIGDKIRSGPSHTDAHSRSRADAKRDKPP